LSDKKTKFCVNCGAEIDARAEICPKCGVRVALPPPPPPPEGTGLTSTLKGKGKPKWGFALSLLSAIAILVASIGYAIGGYVAAIPVVGFIFFILILFFAYKGYFGAGAHDAERFGTILLFAGLVLTILTVYANLNDVPVITGCALSMFGGILMSIRR
jgi:hypothetical protein